LGVVAAEVRSVARLLKSTTLLWHSGEAVIAVK
jgi:hypothetical protein